ncbi:MAG TPA: aminotransferase class III-fold pyridoxal phosphate-dependent enzyme [Myxococcota bacterium]|jgi:acetylornithine/N-succinyldiaminopimelate aminotransferase|nr:aminotransferase class III-fold pyridoxal phosphate-dependent enzyme [Myxococcota bacterium]
MPRRPASPLDPLLSAPAVRAAAEALVAAVTDEARKRSLDPGAYGRALRELGRLRGRPLLFPALSSGTGSGAWVRLADGRELLDFIGGIGVYGLGHAERDLLATAAVAAAADSVYQGHLLPGPEYLRLSRALRRHAGRRLRHVWLSTCGAMANENALKMILQKRAPADRIVVFERAFAGRTTTLAELTDKPAYREGLPLRGNVLHVPFYDPDDPRSTERSLATLDAHLARHPSQVAAMMFELVQGEGGVRTAPRSFFATLMERCRSAGLAVFVDEVQTFARTGELFAFRTLGLEEYVDVATAGKVLQGAATLFSKAYAPREGLVAGTYAGSTVGLAVGARIVERLEREGYLGASGRIAALGHDVARRVLALRRKLPRAVGEHTGVGAMHAVTPFDGSPALLSAVLRAAFDEGLLVFGAGSHPSRLRMLLPVNVTQDELDAGFAMLERALRRVADEKGIAC